ncbi:MAG: redox-regulated ATPase YchF [Candidatus Schekmanbacteria bacterium GWA2_38_9]|uniref:Ribosome-binding ATPase YchF n=1 Tax=Candidatus Schekmanbacteria bacterium RIFCSPLOWO2_12_FULL_38_15 TaxID=1817883 RepID=A0A1F7SDI8_9BACT|nr:MAG: redox-regulated ATPase YchF [Candidatus Schekmanbacteria bacterium GWA2_38_9]OGL48265.1 MAG: redox-regulated ATPase YchF [Candidatus Schekmanbacteria bacterium RIFCSPLOWO2_02_FULL_38_14]OGL51304.1 MAG: redox-regulated ATPase YchF [Candidatus Schekmanbacteria bacterium RIFCSPLOWO2_12_FULL_38_15]
MGFNCGIVGLPNAGKSTIFNALTSAHAEVASYPFCTINPNVGIVKVPDKRLDKIAEIIKPERAVHTTMEIVDIAGLVRGASKGEGLGNQFLGNIRNVDSIIHVLRCFKEDDIAHVEGAIDPLRDMDIVNTELILADIENIDKRIEKNERLSKIADKKLAENLGFFNKIRESLNQGVPIRVLKLNNDETETLKDILLLSQKPTLYVINTDENEIEKDSDIIKNVGEKAQKEGAKILTICGKVEAEVAQLLLEEREEFLKSMGINESGLEKIISAGYELLNLITFFTTQGPEVKAWTIKRGTTAQKAAGKIHSDFEKGFIKAEVYCYEELLRLGSEHEMREKGLLRIEGREYEVKDGDIIHFRFNV